MSRIANVSAAALALFTAALHGLVGTFDTLQPVLDADLPLAVRGTMAACWHFLTVFMLCSAWVFLKKRPESRMFASLWVAAAVAFIVTAVTMGGLSGLLTLPQWTLLLPTGGIALFAARA